MPSREFRFNVRELIASAETQLQDDWSLDAAARARAGSRVHARLLEERQAAARDSRVPGEYRKEVWLSERFVLENGREETTVLIQGRLDGMRATDDGWLVEEIKSVVLGADDLDLCRLQVAHAEQCAFYCALLYAGGERVAGGQVVYASVREAAERSHAIDWEPAAIRELLINRAEELVARIRREEGYARWRAQTAERLRLPFAAPRPDQALMLRDVASVAEDGLDLLCSAPTGTGKTAGALLPMTRAALRSNGRLFFVTSRVSQQELALETLRGLLAGDGDRDSGADEKGRAVSGESAPGLAMQLRAKERSCPLEIMRCVDGVCPYITDFADRVESSGILAGLTYESVVSADRITEQALADTLCPFEVSLLLAGRSTVIVADYNYVFDPAVYLRRFFDGRADPVLRRRRFLVVDEAHNLPERARGYYSPRIDLRVLESLVADCTSLAVAPLGYAKPENDVFFRAAAIFSDFRAAFRKGFERFAEEQGESPFYVERPESFGSSESDELTNMQARVQEIIAMYFAWLGQQGDGEAKSAIARGTSPDALPFRILEGRRYRDHLLETLYACRNFLGTLAADVGLFAWVWHGQEQYWQALCLDPAPFLERRFADSFFASVIMSATLTPAPYYKRQLGLSDALHLDLRGGFAPEHRCVVAHSGVDTRFKSRSESVNEIVKSMARVAAERPGNYLAFFPSFAFRDEVAAALPDAFAAVGDPDVRLIHQTPAMPAGIVLRMLAGTGAQLDATQRSQSSTLLLAVHGGVFSEGVDFPGELAIGAFIVSPALPQLDIERQLIREYMDHQDEDGFDYAFVQPGIQRCVQAAGRVIRTEQDRGVIVLFGARFAEERYREKLPANWQQELEYFSSHDSLGERVRRFWAGAGDRPARTQ